MLLLLLLMVGSAFSGVIGGHEVFVATGVCGIAGAGAAHVVVVMSGVTDVGKITGAVQTSDEGNVWLA